MFCFFKAKSLAYDFLTLKSVEACQYSKVLFYGKFVPRRRHGKIHTEQRRRSMQTQKYYYKSNTQDW